MISLKSPTFAFEDLELIIFDKDGTLTDCHIYWIEIIKRRSKLICSKLHLSSEYYQSLALAMGGDLLENRLIPQGPIAIESRDIVISSLLKHLKKDNIYVERELLIRLFDEVNNDFCYEVSRFIKPIQPACELVYNLASKNVKLALVTSDTRANALEAIKYIGIEKYFDLVLGRDSSVGSKKTGEPALITCKKLIIDPSKTIAIGDAEMDSVMAQNASLNGCILVSTGQTPFHDLFKYRRTTVDTLSKLTIIE